MHSRLFERPAVIVSQNLPHILLLLFRAPGSNLTFHFLQGARMKTLLIFLASLLSVGFVFAAGQQAPPTSIGSNESYRVVHGWPQLPEGRVLGSVSGVGIDRHGNVFVFHRNERTWPPSDILETTLITGPTVAVLDARTGEVLEEWGENTFAMPHGLTVDRDDNVWVTDVALHQVYKFTHDGKLLLTLGKRGVSGNDATHFNRPTDVEVATNGNVFVSDGHSCRNGAPRATAQVNSWCPMGWRWIPLVASMWQIARTTACKCSIPKDNFSRSGKVKQSAVRMVLPSRLMERR
jgi:hypothetical protein